MTAMETYTKALDAALDAWISDKFFTTDTGGDIGNQVNTIKEVVKAYYLRKWMAENGFMDELAQLTMIGADGKPAVDVFSLQKDHIEALTKSLTELMVKLQPIKDASKDQLDAIGGVQEESTQGSSSDENSSSEESGNDDFATGAPPEFGEEPVNEETPGQTTEETTAEEETPPAEEKAGAKPAETSPEAPEE